jgi:Ca2+/Na+ antiporter
MPCSTSLGGNAALLVIYGFALLKAAQFLSEGSELLLEVMSPGIIGGLVLPILGAFPDALLITVSGLGASQEEAQEEVLVGMGLVAGSSVMVLTALWGSCLIAGRCDLETNRAGQLMAKDKKLTKGFSLTGTGVTNDKQTMWASWIMVVTLLPYLVAQIPRLFGLNTNGHAFIAVAAGIAVLNLIGYCIYQIAAPWIQERRIEFAKQRYRRSHAFYQASHFSKSKGWGNLFDSNGQPNEEVWRKLFNHFDEEQDSHLTKPELKGLLVGLDVKRHNGEVPDDREVQHWMTEFDISNDGKISFEEFLKGITHWMKSSKSFTKKKDDGSHSGRWDTEAQAAKDELALLSDENEEDDDEDDDKKPPSKNEIIASAVGYLILGAAVAAVFADPLVDAIGGFSKASGISPFFISFIATPLATNSSEAISSLIFAKRKRKKTISMTYSQIYGAVTMNNTMCLGIFLAIVYFRHLLWDFSAEISVIFFATVIMGAVAAFRTTFPLWMAFIGLALYPLSIALVAFLDYVCGWH